MKTKFRTQNNKARVKNQNRTQTRRTEAVQERQTEELKQDKEQKSTNKKKNLIKILNVNRGSEVTHSPEFLNDGI